MTKSNASKRYDREFKLGAVKLVVEEGRRPADVAESLGASEPSIRQWVQAYKRDQGGSFPGSGKLSGQDECQATERMDPQTTIFWTPSSVG